MFTLHKIIIIRTRTFATYIYTCVCKSLFTKSNIKFQFKNLTTSTRTWVVLVVELDQSNVTVIDQIMYLNQLRPVHQIKLFVASVLYSFLKSTQVSTDKGEDRNGMLIHFVQLIFGKFSVAIQNKFS